MSIAILSHDDEDEQGGEAGWGQSLGAVNHPALEHHDQKRRDCLDRGDSRKETTLVDPQPRNRMPSTRTSMSVNATTTCQPQQLAYSGTIMVEPITTHGMPNVCGHQAPAAWGRPAAWPCWVSLNRDPTTTS